MDLSLASPGQFRVFVAFADVVQSVTTGENFKGCAQAPQGLMLRLGVIVFVATPDLMTSQFQKPTSKGAVGLDLFFVFPFMGWEMKTFTSSS